MPTESSGSPDLLPGAHPQSWSGGSHGALVLHGFTGSPHSMRPLAEAFSAAGFTVELPLLPGHGTLVEDLQRTSWADWSATVEAAYGDLAARCDRVVVAGLSMGGTLSTWLASRHPEIAGLIAINPIIEPSAEVVEALEGMVAVGVDVVDAVGDDIAKEGVTEHAYTQTPLPQLVSLLRALDTLDLSAVTVPLLLFTSPQDHVVVPTSSEVLASGVSGPVSRVTCEQSFHVATLDHDAALIEAEAVRFARQVCQSS